MSTEPIETATAEDACNPCVPVCPWDRDGICVRTEDPPPLPQNNQETA